MYKRILVPLDGSKRAEAILPHVENLAKRQQASVVLMHVMEEPMMLGHDEVIDTKAYLAQREKVQTQAGAYLQNVGKGLEREGITVSTRIEAGPTVNAILKVAESEYADLIAMASHGFSGWMRTFYGSVTAGLLNKVDRPILVIRSRREANI